MRFGPVNELAQGEQLVLCGEAWTKASLAGRTQAVALGPIDNAVVEDGRVQSAEWFSDCYGAIITGARLISLLEDRRDEGRLDCSWECATLECIVE